MSAAVERARLRYLVLSMLHDGLRASGLQLDEIARKAGVSERRVRRDLDGDGNLDMNTIGVYMHAMGFEMRLGVAEPSRRRDRRRSLRLTSPTRKRR